MNRLITELLHSMHQQLEQVAHASDNQLQRAGKSCDVVSQTIEQLKQHILAHEFKSKEEEISFFKEEKPQFVRELIFYRELLNLEMYKPVGSKKILRKYYQDVLARIGFYFARHQSLYVYHAMGETRLDEEYFLRSGSSKAVELDNRFSTVQSYYLGKLQGMEMLRDYIQQCITSLAHPLQRGSAEQKKMQLVWTAKKTDLIEFAVSLHANGSINHGKGDVKQIINWLEYSFNTSVGNFYRTIQNMRIRKKNKSPFLSGLQKSYEQRMDEADYS